MGSTKLAPKKAAGATKDPSPSARRGSKKVTPRKKGKSKGAQGKDGAEATSPRDVTEDILDELDSSRTPEATRLLREALAPATSPVAMPSLAEAASEAGAPVAVAVSSMVVTPEGVKITLDAKASYTTTSAPATAAVTDSESAAQQCVAMCMALNRCLIPATARVRNFNFVLDSLVGFDMQNASTVVVGQGTAAERCASLFGAFGGTVSLACPEALGGNTTAAELSQLLAAADIVAVHAAPTASTPVWLGKRARAERPLSAPQTLSLARVCAASSLVHLCAE